MKLFRLLSLVLAANLSLPSKVDAESVAAEEYIEQFRKAVIEHDYVA